MGAEPPLHAAVITGPLWISLAGSPAGRLAGGGIAYSTNGVTGLSNVFKSGIADGPLWTGAVRAVATLRPGLPVVGYERGEDLAAARPGRVPGAGALRIWARGSAVP